MMTGKHNGVVENKKGTVRIKVILKRVRVTTVAMERVSVFLP